MEFCMEIQGIYFRHGDLKDLRIQIPYPGADPGSSERGVRSAAYMWARQVRGKHKNPSILRFSETPFSTF